MTLEYDICVVGAGMVGATAAVLLAQQNPNLRLAVVDKSLPQPMAAGGEYDLRVSAISRASQRILDACSVWEEVASFRHSPYHRMCVWDSSTAADQGIVFDCAELAEKDLGSIVENRVIQLALVRRLRALSNVDLVVPGIVSALDIESDEQSRSIVLEDKRRLYCRLVVAADGSQSKLRQLAGIDSRGWSYQQRGVVATVKTELSHQQTAWQRFLGDGPIAFLPLGNDCSSIVWSCPEARAQTLIDMPTLEFNAAVTAALDGVLGEVNCVSQRLSFPLSLMHAQHYVQDGLALVGDAAHVVHPLAGQGANLGFLDAACLAEVVSAAITDGRYYYERASLRKYERWRKGENLLVMSMLDGLKRVFDNQALVDIRSVGLNWVGRLGPVKNYFVRHGMGLAGDLPKIAQV